MFVNRCDGALQQSKTSRMVGRKRQLQSGRRVTLESARKKCRLPSQEGAAEEDYAALVGLVRKEAVAVLLVPLNSYEVQDTGVG